MTKTLSKKIEEMSHEEYRVALVQTARRLVREEAVKAAKDWFTLPLRYRTKQNLIQSIENLRCPQCEVRPLGDKPIFLATGKDGIHICEVCWQLDRDMAER
jgi:hypothetical protein